MKPPPPAEITKYVEKNIGTFHAKRLASLEGLKLEQLLKRKNPYLFKAKNVELAQDLVRLILDAHLSSQEETIFGEFLEGLAIFINNRTFGGNKSSTEGIDLDFSHEGIRYLVSIKSGPKWGNSSQIKKMKDNFRTAAKILRQGHSKLTIVAVNGCCYGRDGKPDKGDYQKLCGQRFWEFISGMPNLYTDVVQPLGYKAKEKNSEFDKKYAQIVNRFTQQFTEIYCNDGKIKWEDLVRLNSSTLPPKRAPRKALIKKNIKQLS